MNSADMANLGTVAARRAGPRSDFVDGAVQKLAAAVSARETASGVVPATPAKSLAHALDCILRHFGCAVDEMSLAAALRGEDVEASIRRVAQRHHIHIREVRLEANDKRTFGGPVLAFRGPTAVVLLPGMWKHWSEVTTGPAPGEPLQTRAFAFYRTLSPEASRVRDFLLMMCGRESVRDLAWALTWGAVAAALSTVSVHLTRWLVDWALPQGDKGGLALLATGWAVVAFTSSNLRLSRSLLQARIGARIDVNTEAALVSRALSLPMSVLKGLGAGDLSERIGDACQFGKVAYGTVTDTVIALGTAVGYAVMLATTSSKATMVVGAVMLLRAALSGLAITGMYYEGRKQAVERGRMSSLLFEVLSSVSRVKVASAEPRAFYQWASGFAKVRRAGYRASLLSGFLVATEGLFDIGGTIALYAICCGGTGVAALNMGSFVVATSCLGGIQGAYSGFIRGMSGLFPIIPKAARVRPLLEAPAEVHSGAMAPATLDGNLSLRQVSFHYADDEARILDDVSLDIQAGQFVAIVGPSGCGKSTLIKLMLGFYAPSSGSILLDGRDLDSLDMRAVRRQIGAVLQGSELLPSSILFNIVGTTKKTLEDAWIAARRACIAEDIERMPMKMWTALSDRAVTISGGQKQRILIARALVREPKLVIFDEATSALDNKTQAGVMNALREMSCTKICIAHRLSTVVHADRIIVMNKGAIVQQGTYESLMREGGLFKALAETQLGSEEVHATEVKATRAAKDPMAGPSRERV
jgi:ABC-type bacteriocin/lantibiotic exporter with double-glycine peptidase domain